MNLFLAILTVFLTTNIFASDFKKWNNTTCQTKLLGTAAVALSDHVEEVSISMDHIRFISYNFGIKNRPRVVLVGRRKDDTSLTCIVQVFMKPIDDQYPCPNFVKTKISQTCNKPQ